MLLHRISRDSPCCVRVLQCMLQRVLPCYPPNCFIVDLRFNPGVCVCVLQSVLQCMLHLGVCVRYSVR